MSHAASVYYFIYLPLCAAGVQCSSFTCTYTHAHTHTHMLQCDASEATWQLIQSVLNQTNDTTGEVMINPFKIMFLGGGCSLATEPLAALSGRFYNVTQVQLNRENSCHTIHVMYMALQACIQDIFFWG